MARISMSRSSWRVASVLFLASNVMLCRGWLQAVPLVGRMTTRLSSSGMTISSSSASCLISTSSSLAWKTQSRAASSSAILRMSSALDDVSEGQEYSNYNNNRPPRGTRPPPMKPQGAFVLLEGR